MTDTDKPDDATEENTDFPTAVVRTRTPFDFSKYVTKVWFITGACLLLAIILVVASIEPSGPEIRITFLRGHGIQAGNPIRYRGIDVGTVKSVELSDRQPGTADGVEVVVELRADAESFARHGSEFWIVRPQVSLSRVAGLETVVGARYIGTIPGDPNAAEKFEFEGRESPLVLTEEGGIDISIRFAQGHGLSVGDPVRHRGIAVGEVTNVLLDYDLESVLVNVRLNGGAAELARGGTRFWIERPTVSAAEVRGLDTVVRGRYIAVEPGSPGADSATDFEGVDTPPAATLSEGGVEIVLEANQRGGLRRGVPILYRGVPIGKVISVALASDSASVEARAGIETAYTHLVRDNSVFWNSSGVELKVGLDGVRVTADTLSSIVVGGISMATPDQPGTEVRTGARFKCEAKADPEWLTWTPHLPLGVAGADARALPVPLRASLHWERRVVIRRPRLISGWVTPLEGGMLLGPADLLSPVEDAVDGQILETAGQEIVVDGKVSREIDHRLALLTPARPLQLKADPFPLAQVKQPEDVVDCLIVTAGLESEISLDSHRFVVGGEEGIWEVTESIQIADDYHGAPVVSREDGKLIGVLLIEDGVALVALVPKLPR